MALMVMGFGGGGWVTEAIEISPVIPGRTTSENDSYVVRTGKIALINLDFEATGGPYTKGQVVYTLPEGFRPPRKMYVWREDTGTSDIVGIYVEPDGRVVLKNAASGNTGTNIIRERGIYFCV